MRVARVHESDAFLAQAIDAAATRQVVRQRPEIGEFEGQGRIGRGVGGGLQEDHIRRIRSRRGPDLPALENIGAGRKIEWRRHRCVGDQQNFEPGGERQVATQRQGQGIGRSKNAVPAREAITRPGLRGDRDGIVAEVNARPRRVGGRGDVEGVDPDTALIGMRHLKAEVNRAAQAEFVGDLLATKGATRRRISAKVSHIVAPH